MNDKKLNIQVGGGALNIGAITQGDNSDISVGAQTVQAERGFDTFFTSLDQLEESHRARGTEIELLRNEIQQMRGVLESEPDGTMDYPKLLRDLIDRYGWAADLLKKLFALVT